MTNKHLPYYPNLEAEISKSGIKKHDIARELGLSSKSFSNKITGKTDFWYKEICYIQERIFPHITKEELFKHEH